jgi:uncharacterized protein YcfL
MKKILAVSVVALGLAGCTAREQQLVAAGAVGALAGAVVANGVSDSYHRPVYVERRPVVYQQRYIPQRQCYIVDHRTPYGIRQERVCR